MPYIKPDDRKFVDATLQAETPGELNYLITKLVHQFIQRRGQTYATYNEVIGVLECAKLELYRRMVAKYEDQKILENGDVP